eukprot:5000449-Amphidinium_carterae.1
MAMHSLSIYEVEGLRVRSMKAFWDKLPKSEQNKTRKFFLSFVPSANRVRVALREFASQSETAVHAT